MTDKNPKARYPVGKDARAQEVLRAILPTRVMDALLARVFGI
ncbi:hypothetical protein [Lentzea sp. NBRC 105346]|nr:hypothetical protein [Lentzea sp. NBRC 105346]